jgi:signal transduction histidine kinase
MRIRNQLVLMAAAVLVPMVLAAALAIDKIREGEREAALRGLRETARATALVVDRDVQGALSAMKALGNSRSLEMRDFAAFQMEAAAIDRKPDVWTVLLDANAWQIVNTRLPYDSTGSTLPMSNLPGSVKRVLSTRQPLVSDLFDGPQSKRLISMIYTPADAAGGNAFVLAQVFSVDFWAPKLKKDMPADWIVAITDRTGRIMARSHMADEFVGKPARPELVAAASATNDGLIRIPTLEGIDSYAAFTHSSLTGWTIAVAAPSTSVVAAADQAVRVAMSGMLLAAAAAVIVAAAFGRNFIRAIEGAGKAAEALGRGETPVIDKSGVQEVNQLNKAIAHAGRLLEIERESRRSVETQREELLARETHAREAAQAQNEAAQAQNEAAQAQNEAKDQFLAMLGHELRNPLAAITGAVSLMERGSGEPARSLDIIRRQSGHLAHIVNDLLDVSRLMAGKIMLERQPVDLALSASTCAEALANTERAAGYRITVQAVPVWVDGDPVRIEQILNNLLTNALKFSPSGSEVKLDVREDGGRAVVTVTDPGTGMQPELLAQVFEPFMQGPPPANRTQSGMGIGLALVKQLVGLHGGEVHAHSAGAGQGSSFEFWMPAISAPQEVAPPPALTIVSARKLVYVEDNDDARATMAELLRVFGYEVVEVSCGQDVLEAVAAAQPDAVLMDIGLPDMDGYEVARGLRADPRCSHVPLVALTGYGQLRDKEAAAHAGFNAHLIKPVDVQQMVRTLEGAIAG